MSPLSSEKFSTAWETWKWRQIVTIDIWQSKRNWQRCDKFLFSSEVVCLYNDNDDDHSGLVWFGLYNHDDDHCGRGWDWLCRIPLEGTALSKHLQWKYPPSIHFKTSSVSLDKYSKFLRTTFFYIKCTFGTWDKERHGESFRKIGKIIK